MPGVDSGQITHGQYAALMIEEGHDFQLDWFKLVMPMVDRAAHSLLVLYSDAQTIDRDKGGSVFSFSAVGIKAQGRRTIRRLT